MLSETVPKAVPLKASILSSKAVPLCYSALVHQTVQSVEKAASKAAVPWVEKASMLPEPLLSKAASKAAPTNAAESCQIVDIHT